MPKPTRIRVQLDSGRWTSAVKRYDRRYLGGHGYTDVVEWLTRCGLVFTPATIGSLARQHRVRF
ncbi:MAG: hypothetical protein RhofKO_25550 [Rhodothermales bacterium]